MGNTGRGWREEKSFKDIFWFSVDSHPLISIQNTVLMVTHQSLSSGVISNISCTAWAYVSDFGFCSPVNHRAGRGDPAWVSAYSFLQLFQQQMLIRLSMFCSFWEFKNNLPNEAVLSSSYVQTDRSEMLQFRKQSRPWWQCLWTSPPRPFFK